MKARNWYLILVLLLATACKPDKLCEDQEGITVTHPESAPANLVPVALTASICKDADHNKRTLTFTITGAATFQNDTQTIQLQVDDAGHAIAYVKNATAELTRIKVAIGEPAVVEEEVFVRFLPIEANEVFAESVSPAGSVAANGRNEFEIRVRVADSLALSGDKVIFSTDAGTFRNGNDSVHRYPAADTTAVAWLKTSVAGTAALTINYKGISKVIGLSFAPVTADSVLRISLDNDTVTADGSELLRLQVEVFDHDPADTDKVTFETTRGEFAGPSDPVPNASGFAEAFLKSTDAGAVWVTATYKDHAVTSQATFVSLHPDDIFTTQVLTAGTLPANNQDNHEIEGQVHLNPGQGTHSITYTATSGTFQNNNDTMTLLADQNGLSRAFLKNNTAGTATVTATYTVSGATVNRTEALTFSALPLNQVLATTVDSIDVPADGASFYLLTARLLTGPPYSDIRFRTGGAGLTFEGSSGTGGDLTVTPDGTGVARVRVRATERGTYGVTVSTAHMPPYVIDTLLSFLPAFPDWLTISAVGDLNTGSPGTVKAQLHRTIGLPESGLTVHWRSTNPILLLNGTFSTSTQAANFGEATIGVLYGDTSSSNLLVPIEAGVERASGDTLWGQGQLFIKP